MYLLRQRMTSFLDLPRRCAWRGISECAPRGSCHRERSPTAPGWRRGWRVGLSGDKPSCPKRPGWAPQRTGGRTPPRFRAARGCPRRRSEERRPCQYQRPPRLPAPARSRQPGVPVAPPARRSPRRAFGSDAPPSAARTTWWPLYHVRRIRARPEPRGFRGFLEEPRRGQTTQFTAQSFGRADEHGLYLTECLGPGLKRRATRDPQGRDHLYLAVGVLGLAGGGGGKHGAGRRLGVDGVGLAGAVLVAAFLGRITSETFIPRAFKKRARPAPK